MSNSFFKGRGATWLKSITACYCPKCGMWGFAELWYSMLGSEVYSTLHQETIEGKVFTIKRCWY